MAVFDQMKPTAHAGGRGGGRKAEQGGLATPRFLQLLTHALRGEAAWARAPSWTTPRGLLHQIHEAESASAPAAGLGVGALPARPQEGEAVAFYPGLLGRGGVRGQAAVTAADGWPMALPVGKNRPPQPCFLCAILGAHHEQGAPFLPK